ncbi:aspartate kinase [Thermicanus aegyptius]|uniref:aspartate kinase n=1 Tax=Thermicanus aegyptius TaxID=94009 RepID=UPI0003F7D182|nr:aspartate kinase [Thermicanus aegyptius]
MGILVQKFGGTSLTDHERRERALFHIRKGKEKGYDLVVVVSAMGRKGDPYATDTLLSLLEDGEIPPREKDLLMSTGEVISAAVMSGALWKEGLPNTILLGGQAGILTNDRFGNALITDLRPERVRKELEEGKIVIVPGFQGMTLDGEITTLGRGGSDTTATAIGVALGAEYVDIFTDVEGIMTADPRIVREARPIDVMTYTEVANLAHLGAKVIHPRAVEIAMQKNIPIRVRSTFGEGEGTLITSLTEVNRSLAEVKDRIVTGVTQVPHITQVKVRAERGEFDLQLRVFKAMAEHGISVDFINVSPSGVVYTVYEHEGERTRKILAEMGYEPELLPGCAKVSVVGAGIAGTPGVMAKIVEALVEEEIRILQSADSHTTIWVLVKLEDMNRAVRAIHRKFHLNE